VPAVVAESAVIDLFGGRAHAGIHQPAAQGRAPARHIHDQFGANLLAGDVVRRLDNVLPEIVESGERIFLKMDTQGWDLEVLRGASGVLGDIKAIQSEVSLVPIYGRMPNLQASLDHFRELGFSLAGLFRVTYDSSNRVVEFGCVCVADTSRSAA
jgi:Methyltransferase FkbM domain